MQNAKAPLKTKLKSVGTNIFTAMNQVAAEHNAINLAQGFPNFPCSEELIDLVHMYMKKGFNQYAPMPGVVPLRETISQKIEALHGRHYDPESEITVTAGGHLALQVAISSVVFPGDEVILFEPAFDCFTPIIELNGGIPKPIEIVPPHCRIDWDKVRATITPRTRMIIINSPHNPTGSILEESDMRALIDITKNTDIYIMSDEVYEHIIFDGAQHQSICRYSELAERSFAMFSFGKVFHITGWKIAYCVAPKSLMSEFRRIYQMVAFTANAPIQYAISDFLQKKEHYLNLPDFYQKKRDFFLQSLEGSKFRFVPARGTYFQLLSYQGMYDVGDTEAAQLVAKAAKVAAIPISVFCHDKKDHHFLRFCFAKTEETLEQAAERLRSL